jgi:hypothetical protein
MSSLYSELTNLFDQDFMSFEEGKLIFDWLNRHQEDFNNIEIDYLNDISNAQEKVAELEHRLSNCIEPKFKIGQEVWYKPSFTLYSAKIESIKVHYRTSGKVQIQYVVTAPNGFKNHKNEKDLFATEEELKKTLRGSK